MVTNLSEWTTAVAAVNADTKRQIFVQKGFDIGDSFTVDTITRTGTQALPTWIIWYDNVTPSNNGEALKTVEPWNKTIADRAQMRLLEFSAASWAYVVGLSWGILRHSRAGGNPAFRVGYPYRGFPPARE